MGRIRTRWVKSMAKELIKQYPDKFNSNFEKNKRVLDELKIMESKLMRNKVAGYVCKIVEKKDT